MRAVCSCVVFVSIFTLFLILSGFKLENSFDKSRLSLQDFDFVEDVEVDIRNFVAGQLEKRVLVFPPVNNYRRFLIHKLVEEQFSSLTTFSIGLGESRRPVICFKNDYIQSPYAESSQTEQVTKVEQPNRQAGLECPIQPKRERRLHAMPSISIYRPPAARRLEEKNANCGAGPERGPEEKNVCKCSPGADESKKRDSSGISMFKSAISSIRTQNDTVKSKSDVKTRTETRTSEGKVKQRRPDMKVYVPKGRREQARQRQKKSEEEEDEEENSRKDSGYFGIEDSKKPDDCDGKTQCSETAEESVKIEKSNSRTAGGSEKKPEVSPTSLWIEAQNAVTSVEVSGRSAVAPTELSSKEETNAKKTDPVHFSREECDWETMFDDSGECLDPSLLDQLSSAVGAVTIEKPKSNYDPFKTKTLDMVGNEFSHVIEIYNFPPEFQLQDLMTVFSQFKNSGFEIKWVDDTHALGIFSNSQVVSEVLAFHHPFVKTRSLKDGTTLSKAKARRSADFLLPYKPRPDTCPALARRLVTGALGVKLPTSRAEREAERRILMEAREKKRLEAKQREEAWEGTFN